MDGRDVEDLIEEVVNHLRRVSGVAAIVLGGSRARGTATRRSDVDLALYYTPEDPLDLDALQQVAQKVDDERRKGVLTGIGGWVRGSTAVAGCTCTGCPPTCSVATFSR